MLTAEGCAARRERLWAALPAECDTLIITDPSHLIYFANFALSPFEFRSNDASAVLILRPGRATDLGPDSGRPKRSPGQREEAPVGWVVAEGIRQSYESWRT